MRVIFVRMRNEDFQQKHVFGAIIGFGAYGGSKICNCGVLRKQWERSGWRERYGRAEEFVAFSLK